MKFHYVYFYLREDGTPYYVGKGTRYRAFDGDRHVPIPPRDRILIEPYASAEDAFDGEKFFIAYYGRKDLGTGRLLNRTDGGDGLLNPSKELREAIGKRMRGNKFALGAKRSPEERNRISERMLGNTRGLGHKWSPEKRLKIIRANTGKKRSEEFCRRISEVHKGKVISAEHRQKLSASMKAYRALQKESLEKPQ